MTTWETRAPRGDHAAVRAAHRLILDQHRELRRLLALGLVQTCIPPPDHRSSLEALRALVRRICAVFFDHLSDEETALLPLLADDRLGGTRRMQLLREEHARQRRELDALLALSEAESATALADRFDRLARDLLIDIAEEERQLAAAVAVLAEQSTRRCDGVQRAIGHGPHHGSRASKAASTGTR